MNKILLIACLFAFPLLALNQSKKTIDSINDLSYAFLSNNLIKCVELYKENVNKANKIGYKAGKAKAYENLSVCKYLLGDYKPALQLNQKAIDIYEDLGDYCKQAALYASSGYNIRRVDIKEAFTLFKKAIQIAKKHKCEGNLVAIYNNYSVVMSTKNIDSAIYYAYNSYKLCLKENDTVGPPFSLNNLSVYHAQKKEYQKAFDFLAISDKYRSYEKDKNGYADNLAYRADIYYEMPNQVDSAIYYYEKAYRISTKLSYNPLERYCLERLAYLYKKKNNFQKAYFYFEQYKLLEDSVLNDGVKKEMANLEVKYDTEKTKRALSESKLEAEKRSFWLNLTIILLLLLSLVAYLIYYYQKTKRKNSLLNAELEKTKIEKQFNDEKLHIARELHDNIGSHLTFMISSLDNISYIQDKDKQLDKISTLSNFGRLTMKDLRDTIWAMNHDDGELDTLISRIAALRVVIPNDVELKINCSLPLESKLNGLQLLNLYRIAQEFIQNSLKYAEANVIEIILTKNNDVLSFHLNDNGKGFHLDRVNFGNGIQNMKRRCEDLNGKFSIFSDNNGTKVKCEIPI